MARLSTSAPPQAEPTPPQNQTEQTAVPQPVEPGHRAQRLEEVYARALQYTLSKLSWQNFAECYPTVCRRAEHVMKQVHEQTVSGLGNKCNAEFDRIVRERDVVAKLNELEGLIADAEARREAAGDAPPPQAPHTLPPQAILAAHLLPSYASAQGRLNATLEATQVQNALLADQVRQQREEMDALLAQVEGAVNDIKGANEALGPLVDELAAESRR